MIFVTGPLFAGKEDYVCSRMGWSREEFSEFAVRDVQDLKELDEEDPDLESLADRLAGKRAVIATEIGGGVVPTDPAERRKRERAGRLACLLAERAETVVRVQCGLPHILKGEFT